KGPLLQTNSLKQLTSHSLSGKLLLASGLQKPCPTSISLRQFTPIAQTRQWRVPCVAGPLAHQTVAPRALLLYKRCTGYFHHAMPGEIMLTLAAGKQRFCDGINRRSFLRIGSLAMGGLTLPGLLQAQQASGRSSSKAVIMVYLSGGLS